MGNTWSASGLSRDMYESVQWVVDNLPKGVVKLKNGVSVQRYQILTKYPADLVCQLNALCGAAIKDSALTPAFACRERNFLALKLAVAARLGLVTRPVDPSQPSPSGVSIYLDSSVPDVVTADSFDIYVTEFAKANCKGLQVFNEKTNRYRKACGYGHTRSASGRCRKQCGAGQGRRRSSGRCFNRGSKSRKSSKRSSYRRRR